MSIDKTQAEEAKVIGRKGLGISNTMIRSWSLEVTNNSGDMQDEIHTETPSTMHRFFIDFSCVQGVGIH